MNKIIYILIIILAHEISHAANIYSPLSVKCKEDYSYCNDEKNQPLNGEIHFKKGVKVYQIIPYKNGIINGTFLNYFTDTGTLYQEITFIDGKPDGIFKQFHPNGNLFLASPYKKGVLNGTIKVYDKEAIYIMNIIVKDGVATGGKCNDIAFSKKELDRLNSRASVECNDIIFSL